MVRICHMKSAHGKEDNRIFCKECVSLAASGYEVYLIQRGETYDKDGVHIIGAGDIPKQRIKRMIVGARVVYRIAVSLNCDLYHIHDPELIPYGIKLHKMGKKVIFDSHELYREQIKNKGKFGIVISSLYKVYEKNALLQLDGLIFPCPISGKNPYEGMYREFAYVNNVPRLSELYDSFDENQEKEDRTVCYIGTISKSRGISNLIKAVYEANAKLYLAGICHNQEYMKEITEMPEFSCVSYLGILDRGGIVKLLKKVKIGMATLLNVGQYNMLDNLPTKVYEYMAMGIPSIISDTPYNRNINDEKKFGVVVNPDSVTEIAQAILNILSNEDIYTQMARNGRKFVKDECNWEKEANNLCSLYNRIINNNQK